MSSLPPNRPGPGSDRRGAVNRLREAAVAGAAPATAAEPALTLSDRLRLRAADWWSLDPAAQHVRPGRWRDLRLVPFGAGAWMGAAVGALLSVSENGAALGLAMAIAVVVAAATAAMGIALTRVRRRTAAGQNPSRAAVQRGGPRCGAWRRAVVSVAAPTAILFSCLALAFTAGLAAAAAQHAADYGGPAGDLLTRGGQTVATVEVLGDPTAVHGRGAFGSGPRFALQGRLLRATDNGQAFTAASAVRLVGGKDLEHVRAGTTIEVAGRVTPADAPGRSAQLTASSRPRIVDSDPGRQSIGALREALRGSSAWLLPDAAGLLPGMVIGDTTELPPDLEDAMRTVGLGHLTAVSGANFTLLLGVVLVGLRWLRAPRPVVLVGCTAALVGFTLVVGPEPSVLRAAAMGSVGLVAMLSGRAGRSCSAVSAAVLVLVLAEPTLAMSMGFLLSVVATLGIALLGPPLTAVLAVRLPAWLAVTVAVPLAAQLACGPLMVLIQPAFLSMSLTANIAAAPFVPIVTVAGTVALATSVWCPPAAFLATALGGGASAAIAGIARGLAGLPGATVPWPEGPEGALAMAAVSLANAALLWVWLMPSARALAADLTRRGARRLRARGRWARGRGTRGLRAGAARRGRVDR